MLETPSQIIKAKGGAAAVAAIVGKSAGAVRVWKHRNAFPREAWPEIMQAFPEITLDRLMAMESSEPASDPEPAPCPA